MRINSRGLFFCNIYAIVVVTILLFTNTASADLVNIQYKPAIKTGVATCPVKYPATGAYTTSFRHQLTSGCWSCPKGYGRSLNPDINATDACVKTNSVQYSVATDHGPRLVPKPSPHYNGNLFVDPRNGGEWWECPGIRPRRTLHAVTHKAACATKHIIGESTGTAVYHSKRTRSTPSGTFLDPNGRFYSCPAGYNRTIFAVTTSKACEKPATTSKARATKRGNRGCPTGSFQNGFHAGCYTCPTGYKRSLEIGDDLTKMPKACVNVSSSADFVKFAKAEIQKMRGQIEPLVTIIKSDLAKMPGKLDQLVNAKTEAERVRIAGQIAAPIRESLKRLNTAKMQDDPKGISFSFFPSAIAADEKIPVNLRGNRIESSVKGVPLDQAISVGVVGDVSAIIGGNMGMMAAFPTRSEEDSVVYATYAGTLGISAGADVSPEIGIWMDPVWGLGGDSFGVTGGVSYYAGFAMTFWWSQEAEPKFLGVAMSPQAGVSAELEFTVGKTEGGGAPTVKPATGSASTGKPIPLLNGWKRYSSTLFDAPTYYVDDTNQIITLTGMVQGGGYGDIAQLPVGERPAKRLIFNANNHAKTARVDVLPDGKVKWIAGGRDHGWLSLSDITFSLSPRRALALTNGWSRYHNPSYAAPTYAKSGNIVTLEGIVKKASITQGVIATLPSGFRPSKQLVFTVNNHGKQARVDITPDGRVHWIAGGNDYGWVSLSGINFSIARGQPLSLTNGWARYPAAQFAIPSYSKNSGGIVTLQGLVKKSSIKQGVIATLPVGFRPDNRLIFTSNNHAKSARVDIHPDGKIWWIAGGKDHGWVSLSGINFKQRK
jgi:hypothetical protein